MQSERWLAAIEREWNVLAMPALCDYMAIPCESPAFDPDWAARGELERAATLLADWARAQLVEVAGASVEVLHLPGRTPLLLIDVPGTRQGATLIYGHLDKQPAMDGWAPGRSAWTPVLEGERLYGRGGADDGYAPFAAVLALRALHAQGIAHPRCTVLIEASEESGSPDLPAYIEHLAPRLGAPALVIALDAGCGNYAQLWLTTSLRGQVAGTLHVRTLTHGVHSGDASGVVASPWRIATQLLARLEDPGSGTVDPAFQVEIPAHRRSEAERAALALGDGLHRQLPLADGVRPLDDQGSEQLLGRAWRAQLTVTGLDGLPGVDAAAAVMAPALALKLSLRLPPTLDPDAAAQRLQALLEADPPDGAEVRFLPQMISPGWHAPATAPWLQAALERASQAAFAAPCAAFGGGGGIPFLAMLGARFPQAQFVVTGVLGPQSNAHGPNEFLHLPYAQRLTVALALLLRDAADAPV
ncbi:M20/M25/M40 family metallo-hydrolase [Marilutibacter chinensis]|uniref:M20/M25/M40 family metallo-hydrolase n=1 Tax=Marilutibacter chinensis TaxID=2912247 RepID=A0ABS9HXR6_9GAMM|nr:M20/M25/M40 family metallo-hydrolase [Lysobacter chinensis]MCF7223573.1 M20/M25/M40 family metallo-hydrolase [Lysobacter chinensis]